MSAELLYNVLFPPKLPNLPEVATAFNRWLCGFQMSSISLLAVKARSGGSRPGVDLHFNEVR